MLDEGVNALPSGLELLEGLHQLPHFSKAEPGRLALEVERRNVLVHCSLPDQVEQTLEVQPTRSKRVLRGQCVFIGTVESELDDGGFFGKYDSLRHTDKRHDNEYYAEHRCFHGRHLPIALLCFQTLYYACCQTAIVDRIPMRPSDTCAYAFVPSPCVRGQGEGRGEGP